MTTCSADDVMGATPLKWRRQKNSRRQEIIDAATGLFVERGFATIKLDEVAGRARIAKATLYRYLETKEDIFRAVARGGITANLLAIEAAIVSVNGSLKELRPLLLKRVADKTEGSRIPALARMVIGESQSFSDLARIWHDDVAARVLDLVAGLVEGAQKRGEVQPGDPRLFAFSSIGPCCRPCCSANSSDRSALQTPDLHALAGQHARTVLHGLLSPATQFNTDKEGAAS